MKKIAYLGPEKTNAHWAARKKFGRANYLHAATIEEIFQYVERKKADFGVVPIENSLEGAVTHTLDRFIDFEESPAQIFGEIELPIQHFFITRPKTSREKIRIIYSHPQALAQCQRWLDRNYPNVERREKNSTAEAVEELLREDKLWGNERAAIGRKELAAVHKLEAVSIPIDRENRTRFLIITLTPPRPGRRNKTSLMFVLKDAPGALYDALTPFKKYRINLTKIESRPSKRKAWEYIFFIDLEGHQADPRVKRALEMLEKRTSDFRVLGSYPIARSR